MKAQERGFTARRWMTYKQAEELGAQVRKGSKSVQIVHFNFKETEAENAKGETVACRIPMIKTYCVFNADEIAGLPEQY
ncbi:ArdC-like ssDNA-binding domain-containing protein [Phyllobacterium sp. YR620]|uniref:ArdC-like ssDNA-binding domain-containing protein n=1 Tax=Phyllobacterium sp. YR620 TaxID=1881066 RepID=UPI000B843679|nr:ArdC-like ssDNA-binding domain-containing protein [Phyllobacterium sp. YR620]